MSLSAHGHTPTMFRWMMNWYPLSCVYEKQTGLKGHEQVIGGTFGRLLKRRVAFGAMSQTMSILCTKLMNSQMLKISIGSSYLRRSHL